MSLYEVSEVVPGKSLMARDLVRGGEPIAVSEGTATKTLKQWDRIAARVVPVMGRNVFAGGLLPFTPQATDALVDGLRQMFGKKNAKKLPVKGRFLHLATNSAARADKGMALIQQTIGDLVRPPHTEIRTVEQMMAEHPAQDQTEATSDISPEKAEQIVHQFMDRQYRETLDQPVGMLGNKTPRQAAKSADGRQKVAEWLKYLENQSAKQPNSADPMATYSFEWMWHELGVIDLRQ